MDQEPDTYVKTVLTFGDKPAPAMAWIALQSYIQKLQKPSKTTHMDNLYDSLDTIQQAQKQEDFA